MSEDRRGTIWELPEIVQACQMLDDGTNIEEIARVIGRTKAAVVTKLALLGHLYERDGFYYRVITPAFCSYEDLK